MAINELGRVLVELVAGGEKGLVDCGGFLCGWLAQ